MIIFEFKYHSVKKINSNSHINTVLKYSFHPIHNRIQESIHLEWITIIQPDRLLIQMSSWHHYLACKICCSIWCSPAHYFKQMCNKQSKELQLMVWQQSKELKVISLRRRVRASTTCSSIHSRTSFIHSTTCSSISSTTSFIHSPTCSSWMATKYSTSNPTYCFIRSFHSNTQANGTGLWE